MKISAASQLSSMAILSPGSAEELTVSNTDFINNIVFTLNAILGGCFRKKRIVARRLS